MKGEIREEETEKGETGSGWMVGKMVKRESGCPGIKEVKGSE